MKRLLLLALLAMPLAALADSPGGDEIPLKTKKPVDAAAAPAAAAAEALPDGRSLLRAYVEACGGADALKLDNALITSRLSIPAQSMTGTIRLAFTKPNLIRSTVEMTGIGEIEQGYDGVTGWEVNPLSGPRVLGAAELEQLRNSESNPLNLLDVDALYSKAQTVGRTTFAGADAWEVRLTSRDGRESTAYFDVASKLMTGMKTVVVSPLGEVPAVVTLSDYKTFGKLKLPVTSTQALLGMQVSTTLVSVETNVDPSRLPSFSPPAEVLELQQPGEAEIQLED